MHLICSEGRNTFKRCNYLSCCWKQLAVSKVIWFLFHHRVWMQLICRFFGLVVTPALLHFLLSTPGATLCRVDLWFPSASLTKKKKNQTSVFDSFYTLYFNGNTVLKYVKICVQIFFKALDTFINLLLSAVQPRCACPSWWTRYSSVPRPYFNLVDTWHDLNTLQPCCTTWSCQTVPAHESRLLYTRLGRHSGILHAGCGLHLHRAGRGQALIALTRQIVSLWEHYDTDLLAVSL